MAYNVGCVGDGKGKGVENEELQPERHRRAPIFRGGEKNSASVLPFLMENEEGGGSETENGHWLYAARMGPRVGLLVLWTVRRCAHR